jgi:hypothetical protein
VFILLFREILVEVASPAPHTAMRLSAVCPEDMTEFLTVKVLC